MCVSRQKWRPQRGLSHSISDSFIGHDWDVWQSSNALVKRKWEVFHSVSLVHPRCYIKHLHMRAWKGSSDVKKRIIIAKWKFFYFFPSQESNLRTSCCRKLYKSESRLVYLWQCAAELALMLFHMQRSDIKVRIASCTWASCHAKWLSSICDVPWSWSVQLSAAKRGTDPGHLLSSLFHSERHPKIRSLPATLRRTNERNIKSDTPALFAPSGSYIITP